MAEELNLWGLGLDEKEWPMSKRYEVASVRAWQYYGDVMKEVYEKFGDQALECFSNQMRKAAERYVPKALKHFNIPGHDARSVAAYFILADGIVFPKLKWNVVETSEKKTILRCGPPCPIGHDPYGKDLPPEICRALLSHERTAAKLINPKLRLIDSKLMCAGDEYCELIFVLED